MAQYAWMFSVTSIALVFVGWWVTYCNAMRIATRSESKSIVDSLTKLVSELADISIDYWLKKVSHITPPPESLHGSVVPVEAAEYLTVLLAKASQAGHYFKLLNIRGIEADASKLSAVLEKTSLDCEIAYCQSASERCVRANEIMSVCMEVIEDIHSNFQAAYPPSKHISPIVWYKSKVKEIEEWHASMY